MRFDRELQSEQADPLLSGQSAFSNCFTRSISEMPRTSQIWRIHRGSHEPADRVFLPAHRTLDFDRRRTTLRARASRPYMGCLARFGNELRCNISFEKLIPVSAILRI
jgi:hypothetical protein